MIRTHYPNIFKGEPDLLKRLTALTEKTYELIGAKYTEGAKSPVEGAIKKTEE